MTKFKLKQSVLLVALGVFRGLGYAGRYVSLLFFWMFRGFGRILRAIFLPPIVLGYKFFFLLRRNLIEFLAPIRGAILHLFVHRHIIHVAMVIIVIATSLVSLSTRTARAEDLGTGSILYELVTGGTEELIEEEVSSEPESFPTSYLAGITAVSKESGIDFDYFDAPHVQTTTGGRAVIAPRPSRTGPSLAPRTELESYIVKTGDTPSQIAERFNLKLLTLLWANKLTSRSYIRPGDKLTIPPIDGVIHKVQKNDTVAKIAKKYSAKAQDVIAWNKLGGSAVLSVGETLVVPGGKVPVVRRARSYVYTGGRPPGVAASPGGPMLWPTLSRRITQYFGWRHTGLDLGAPSGTAIYAADDGVVESSGWMRGYGNQVLINHGNGIKTRYAHNSRNYVVVGERVTKGDTIAAMGSTGWSTGPHLHFEIIHHGRFRNPLEYIR